MKKKLIAYFLVSTLLIGVIPFSTTTHAKKAKLEKGSVFTYTLNGASVWLVKKMNGLPACKKGTIQDTKDGEFQVKINGKTKWVDNEYCIIDLADVETGIDYNITNSYSSLFKSSKKKISSVTGKKITKYRSGKVKNNRLNKKEYVVPVLYPTAKKIKKAEETLSKQGYTLVIYDTYRPLDAQKFVNSKFSKLIKKNKTVRKNINKYGFGESWFLAQNVSSHSMGVALDCAVRGKGANMPTAMHELSTAARLTSSPISTGNVKHSNFIKGIKNNKAVMALQKAFNNAGMYSLSSEWWHFQDGTAYNGQMKKVYTAIKSKGLNFKAN